jgi:hypothetical protein
MELSLIDVISLGLTPIRPPFPMFSALFNSRTVRLNKNNFYLVCFALLSAYYRANEMGEVLKRLLPIVSNLPYVCVAARSLEYGYGLRAFLFLFVGLFTSPVYHLCMGFPYACMWSVYKHHVVDFWTAELSMPLAALLFIRFRAPFVEKWLILTAVVVIGLLVTGTSGNFMTQAAIGGSSLAFVVVYLVWHKFAHHYWPEYDLVQVVLGLGFSALAVSFFVEQEWYPPYYWYNHSYWHTLGAIGMWFLTGIKEPQDPALNLEARIASSVNALIGRALPFTVPKWQASYDAKKATAQFSKETSVTATPKGYTFVEGFAFAPVTIKDA